MSFRSLDDLDDKEFAGLCVQLLRQEVSRSVRPMAAFGPDGGRDAVLDGACQTKRYNWDGKWIFQFKHYHGDVGPARRDILRIFKREVYAALCKFPTIANYVFVTSVPFSGSHNTGTFDKVEGFVTEMRLETGRNIDFWDGNEVATLLETYPDIARHYKPVPEHNYCHWHPEILTLWDDNFRHRDNETFQLILKNIVGPELRPLNPGSKSLLGYALMSANFRNVRVQLERLLYEARRRSGNLYKEGFSAHFVAWLGIAFALVAARLGDSQVAFKEAAQVIRMKAGDLDLEAWAWNVISIVTGKLNRYSFCNYANLRAMEAAREIGNVWLLETVRIREIHKTSWAASEATTPLDNTYFESVIRIRDMRPSSDLSAFERNHLKAQHHAYRALHYTWQPENHDLADEAICSADRAFRDLGDAAEITRMVSERGRLELNSSSPGSSALNSLPVLQAAFVRRVRSGELARARYDLVWLAMSHNINKRSLAAEICMWLCIAVHKIVYPNRQLDDGIMKEAVKLISEARCDLRRVLQDSKFTGDKILELMHGATGLSVMDCAGLVDPNYFRVMVTTNFV